MLSHYKISNDALFDAIKTVAHNLKKPGTPAYIAKEGYRIPASDFNPGTTFNDATFIHAVLYYYRHEPMALNPDAFKSLDRIVEIARQHHIKLHMFLTPNYPWDNYRLMTLGYWPMWEAWMRKIASYHDVISFSQYNQYMEEAPTLNPKMQWWNDPIHFSLKMGEMMLNDYLGHPSKQTPANFMQSINPNTVESIITERRNSTLRWAATHREFVDNFDDAKTTNDTVSGKLDLSHQQLIVNDKTHPIVAGVGNASIFDLQGSSALVSGWTLDEKNKRPVKQLIATIDNTVVSSGFATVEREDIEKTIEKKSILSGFSLEIPLKNWNGHDPIRVFAIMRDERAIQVPSSVSQIQGPRQLTLNY